MAMEGTEGELGDMIQRGIFTQLLLHQTPNRIATSERARVGIDFHAVEYSHLTKEQREVYNRLKRIFIDVLVEKGMAREIAESMISPTWTLDPFNKIDSPILHRAIEIIDEEFGISYGILPFGFLISINDIIKRIIERLNQPTQGQNDEHQFDDQFITQ